MEDPTQEQLTEQAKFYLAGLRTGVEMTQSMRIMMAAVLFGPSTLTMSDFARVAYHHRYEQNKTDIIKDTWVGDSDMQNVAEVWEEALELLDKIDRDTDDWAARFEEHDDGDTVNDVMEILRKAMDDTT